MTDNETQQRLDAMPASREQQYQELFATYDATDGEDAADTAIEESVLGVESTRGFEVTISTGGPGEWLECTVDEDNDVASVTFCCAWWSPVQRSTVNESDALWRLAERMNPWVFE